MSRKKLMIMGGGIYQVPLIEKAKKMGLGTIVVSIPGNYPGISLGDQYVPLDTRDCHKVLKLAQEEGIAGICTSGTDVAVNTIGYVCSHMGLSGITQEAARAVTDKALMKECFYRGNVSTPQFRKVMSFQDATEAAEEFGLPVIIKPVDSSGSRGVRKVSTLEELQEAYQEAQDISSKGYFLVEEFIEAEEIGVDGFVGEKGIEVFLPHEKYTYTTYQGVTLPAGHSFPYGENQELIDEIYKQMSLSVQALGLKNCAFNADIFVRGSRVWVIEIGGRTGATCIPELISLYQGYDWYEKIVEAALGLKPNFSSQEKNPCMARLIFSPINSKIERIDKEVLSSLDKDGIKAQLDYTVGDYIEEVKNGTDRIGHIIVPTSNLKLMEEFCSKLRSCIWITQGNLETIWRQKNEN